MAIPRALEQAATAARVKPVALMTNRELLAVLVFEMASPKDGQTSGIIDEMCRRMDAGHRAGAES